MECQAEGVFVLPKITNQVKRKTQTQTIGIKYLFFTYETRNMMQPIVSQNSNMRSISTVSYLLSETKMKYLFGCRSPFLHQYAIRSFLVPCQQKKEKSLEQVSHIALDRIAQIGDSLFAISRSANQNLLKFLCLDPN